MRRLIFSLAVVAVLCGVVWYFHEDKYHVQLPIQFSSAGTPVTEVVIEKNSFLLEVDLGSKFPMSLRKTLLDQISQKSTHGMGEWKDVKGNRYQAPSYAIPQISLATLALHNIVIQQEDDEYLFNATIWDGENAGKHLALKSQGSLGMPLLRLHNFLLDLRHSALFISNDKRELKKAGYNIENFVSVPFEIGRIGIILKVTTGIGQKNLSIDTGSTLNLIRSSFFHEQKKPEEKPGLPLFTSTLLVGGATFGSEDFYLYDITPELSDIDGFLGVPFLKKHAIYLDFQNKQAYIETLSTGK
jgi:hypothetical protein